MTFLEPGARVALATTPTPTPNMPFDATAARRSTRLKPIENVRVNTTGIVREIGTSALGHPLVNVQMALRSQTADPVTMPSGG